MRMFVGLTKKMIVEYNNIVVLLRELGIFREEEIEEGLLTEREMRIIKMVGNVRRNPQIDLWKQSVESL